MLEENNVQDEGTAPEGNGAGASAMMVIDYMTNDQENNSSVTLRYHTYFLEEWYTRVRHYFLDERDSAIRESMITTTQNWMDDLRYGASGGESIASNGDHATTTPYNQIYDSGYVAGRGESLNSVSDNVQDNQVSDLEDSSIANRSPIVSEETNIENDVHIHEHVAEGDEMVSIAHRRLCNRIMRGQARLNNHQSFTYPRLIVDGYVQPADMIVPSGAYYCSNHNPPMLYPSSYRNPVSENVYSGPEHHTDDAYSFGPLSQRDLSYESHSDQGFGESSVYEEINAELE